MCVCVCVCVCVCLCLFRWTGSAQPFAALTDASYLTRHTHSDAKKAKATEAWGADLTGVKDVQACFEKFYKGETSLLPW